MLEIEGGVRHADAVTPSSPSLLPAALETIDAEVDVQNLHGKRIRRDVRTYG